MYLAYYSKEHKNLSLNELYALLGKDKIQELKNGIVLIKNNIDLEQIKRLSYTKKVSEILFVDKSVNNIINKIKSSEIVFDKYNKNFAFRKIVESNIHQSSTKKDKSNQKYNNVDERDFADLVGSRINEISKKRNIVNKLKVNLDNPNTLFELIFIDDKIYFCINIYSNENDHQQRSPDKRESFFPISLKPRLAKTLVNIASSYKQFDVIDPFCGTGGFLIESCLMNIKSIGNDYDIRMVKSTKVNVMQICHKKIEVYHDDFIKFLKKMDKELNNYCIVCDPPYSKNTRNVNFNKIYQDLIICIDSLNVKRAVFMLPLFKGYDKKIRNSILKLYYSWFNVLKNYSFELLEEVYVHNSLSRLVWILKQK